jgi:hypothetical protein
MRKTIGRICCVLVVVTPLLSLDKRESPLSAPPHWFWGCWVVKKLLPTSGVSGLSQKQVDAIIGTRLVFSKTCARSGDVVAPSPEYSTTVLSNRDFFSLGYVPLGQIEVKDSKVVRVQLTKPELSDLEFLGDDVFLRKEDIVIEVENDYFVAGRAMPDDADCTCEKKAPK